MLEQWLQCMLSWSHRQSSASGPRHAGQVPEQPDNVVQPFYQFQMGLFAHKDYIAAFGMPSGVEEYGNHRFVGHDDAQMRAPFFKWMREVVPAHAISFRGLHADALRVAVLELRLHEPFLYFPSCSPVDIWKGAFPLLQSLEGSWRSQVE